MIKKASGYKDKIIIHKTMSKNGDVLSFLLGIIIPSVITFENVILSIISFIIIQMIIYQLMMKSSTVFPNVIMILFFNMNIYKVIGFSMRTTKFTNKEDSIYLINFKNDGIKEGEIWKLGDSKKSNTYYYKEGVT